MRTPNGLKLDSASWPLLLAHVSYWGITSANGDVLGTTLVCGDLANEPSYQGHLVKVLDGAAAGQVKPAAVHPGGGNTITVAAPWTDNAGAVVQIVAGTRFVILSGGEHLFTLLHDSTPLPFLSETWQDVLGIDPTVWTTVLGGTGAVARSVAEEPYQKVILSGPANGDTARLHTVQEFQVGPDTWGPDTVIQRLVMEFEARFDTPASIDEPTFFMGLSAIALADRTSANIAGFILVGGALQAITDDGVGETVSPVGAPLLVNWHKHRIEVVAGAIRFYIDGVLVATHTTAAGEDLPDVNAHGQFYLPQEALANGGELHLSIVGLKPDAVA